MKDGDSSSLWTDTGQIEVLCSQSLGWAFQHVPPDPGGLDIKGDHVYDGPHQNHFG